MTLARRTLLTLPLLSLARPAAAASVELEGKLIQGGLVVGRSGAGSRVQLDGGDIAVDDDGVFLLGFGRDAAPTAKLVVVDSAGIAEIHHLAIAQRAYDIQRIDGLPQNKVEPDRKELERIAAEQKRLDAAKARDTRTPFFLAGFAWPAIGPISGVYGSQRILNGQPRRPHFGVDIAAPEGTPLEAPCGGIVSLADPDLFFTGGTLLIDHGYGLASIFAHMRRVSVKEGDVLATGDMVGELGATGRVTGPHLHWGLYLFKLPLDPQLLVPPMPA